MPGAATARAAETPGQVFLHLGNGQRIYAETPEEVFHMWRTMTGPGTPQPANKQSPKARRKTKMSAERHAAAVAAGKKGAAVAKKRRMAREKAAAAGGGH